ncbi:hypothetical protein MMAD_55760 (plasmid) [Mycolicibacterium madagascariense]|uniref:Cadherin domain-containing protein n=1 Tax=Mycolicibacterium madagascariense TaxID=212765 RepID=A0A7I7XPW1_9MYCO|nr:hypothetical protein MMAD_55760 [Mycolicibacterium madagascariense]
MPSEPGTPAATTEPIQETGPPLLPVLESEQTKPGPVDNDSKSTLPIAVKATASTALPPTAAVDPEDSSSAAESADTVSTSTGVALARTFKTTFTGDAFPAAAVTAAVTPIAPVTQVAAPATGLVGLLNAVVTNLLNPFLAPAPATGDPFTPVVWAVLAYVRRNFFNEAPAITYDPTTTVQTGQTLTGTIGATDPEGDAVTYTVTKGPKYGTLTIDQATGNFTYTPNDIDYDAAQTDSFTVSAADGKFNLLSLVGVPHSTGAEIKVNVLSPHADRVIVNLPAGFTDAQIPRFAADGQSLLFSATPPGAAADARLEIYHVNVDGTGLNCVTCGIADPTPLRAGTTAPRDLFKPVPFDDGTGRILFQSVDPTTGAYTHVIYESDTKGARLVQVLTPAGKPGVIVTDPQREMRISPDGTHVLFSQIQLVPNPLDPPGFITAVPIVGALTPGVDANGREVYTVTDARVVNPVGEGKQWTKDGKGVIVLGGLYEAGNVDDVVVDVATGQVTRLTANLDYDEDADLSPNNQWLVIDSARGLDALTPVTKIERPPFVALLVQGNAYYAYAGTSNYTNVTNQPWLVAVQDDLKGENGIPLFVSDDPSTPEDEGDGWTARSMPSWNADGTQVAFWEANASGQSRLVVTNLKYTTSVGTVTDDTTPAVSTTLPTLASNTPQHVTLPDAGTVAAPKVYEGPGGGTAEVSETVDATTGHVVRTAKYIDYVNGQGMILNGTETTNQSAAENTIHYVAAITVTGTHTGSLTGDVTIGKLTRTVVPTTPGSQITTTLDGETLTFLDPARIASAQAGT